MKVEIDIIVSIAVSLAGRAVILVIMIMCVETFKTNVIIFIGPHWFHILDTELILRSIASPFKLMAPLLF
jgi:hypothetical protein